MKLIMAEVTNEKVAAAIENARSLFVKGRKANALESFDKALQIANKIIQRIDWIKSDIYLAQFTRLLF